MNLSDLVTRVSDDANTKSDITSVKNRIIRNINRISSEVWDGYEWSFRWRNYRIVTDAEVTSGTITATNGSRTITGSASAFLSTHVGWHIYFPGDTIQNWYKIRAYTSASQLELDVPYQGTGGSGKTYYLRHFDYVLPTEIWDLGSLILSYGNRPLSILDPSALDLVGPQPLYRTDPVAVSLYASDSVPTTYTTGTLSGTINTATITGASTAWLDNVYPGDSITIGSYTYTIRSVDSDTQITLYNNQQITSAALTTYTITRQFGRILRILCPSTNKYTIDIRALRKYAPLVNDYDTNELLYRYPNTVCLKAAALELQSQNDLRARELTNQSQMEILKSRAEDESLTKKSSVVPIFSYRTNGRSYDSEFR